MFTSYFICLRLHTSMAFPGFFFVYVYSARSAQFIPPFVFSIFFSSLYTFLTLTERNQLKKSFDNMDKVKLEDLKCSSPFGNDFQNYGACGKIPKPGDKIFSCSICTSFTNDNGSGYRCETCFATKNAGHYHFSKAKKALVFDLILTKLVSEHFTPPYDESQKLDFFCSNSKNGCQEEFLTQKAHEKSCIYQEVSCPSVDCKEVIIFMDVDDHMEQSHKMVKVNKEWNFKGTKKDLNETICCLSSYKQKFFPQVIVKDKHLYFKVIMLDQEVNTVPFDVNMTFFLQNGKNISMKDRVFSVTENDKENKFSKVELEKITEYFDAKSMELTCQLEIEFCLKIVNEKLDEIAKDKKENENLGKSFFEQISASAYTLNQYLLFLKYIPQPLIRMKNQRPKKPKNKENILN